MTALSLSPLAGYVWLAVTWLFLITVLLRRWYDREHRDAAATTEVMESLTSDTTDAHIWDA